jgi:hypothetical protein
MSDIDIDAIEMRANQVWRYEQNVSGDLDVRMPLRDVLALIADVRQMHEQVEHAKYFLAAYNVSGDEDGAKLLVEEGTE